MRETPAAPKGQSTTGADTPPSNHPDSDPSQALRGAITHHSHHIPAPAHFPEQNPARSGQAPHAMASSSMVPELSSSWVRGQGCWEGGLVGDPRASILSRGGSVLGVGPSPGPDCLLSVSALRCGRAPDSLFAPGRLGSPLEGGSI